MNLPTEPRSGDRNGMSPSGKARDFDSRTRRSESGHPSHCGGNHFLNTFKKELPFAMLLNSKKRASISPPRNRCSRCFLSGVALCYAFKFA